MVQVACSVLDVKAAVYSRPLFYHNVNVAVRSFGDAVSDKQNGIFVHPEDFHFYKVGEFDDVVGLFTRLDRPEYLAKAVDFLDVKKEVVDEKDKGR